LSISLAPSVGPVITAAYNTSTTSIVVTWDKIPSNFTASHVVGYEVLVYRNDSRIKPVYVMMVNCENVTIKELERYTAYVISVAGVTRGGKGVYSDPVICMTDEDRK
jgi:netrin-G3 ligand